MGAETRLAARDPRNSFRGRICGTRKYHHAEYHRVLRGVTLFPSLLTASHFVKYILAVHIVTLKHLHQAMEDYPDAANEIRAWVAIVKGARWHNMEEVRSTCKDADAVAGYVVFNIRHNRYRLITVIHYAKTTPQKRTQGHVYIRSFLTHKEYDNPGNWDKKYGAK